MYYNNLFNESNVSKTLNKKQLTECFKKYNAGDMQAREKIIKHNIRLVLYRVNTKFSNFPFDAEEMFSIGLIGLIKSVDNFDVEKNIQFATYATRCIDNEILMYARKENKHINISNLEEPLTMDYDGNELKVEDILEDTNVTFVEDYEVKEEVNILMYLLEQLKERDKTIITSYYGICGRKNHTQQEIAEELGLSQSHVARKIQTITKKLGILYEKYCKEHCKNAKAYFEQESIKQFQTTDDKSEVMDDTSNQTKEIDTSEILQDPKFREIVSLLDEKAKLIVLLKLGCGFEKQFTTEEISAFLHVDINDITTLTKNVLMEYKSDIDITEEKKVSVVKVNKKVNA